MGGMVALGGRLREHALAESMSKVIGITFRIRALMLLDPDLIDNKNDLR